MLFIRVITCSLILLALTTALALATGSATAVTITGPGLPTAVQITHPQAVGALSTAQLEDFLHPVATPAAPDPSYELTGESIWLLAGAIIVGLTSALLCWLLQQTIFGPPRKRA